MAIDLIEHGHDCPELHELAWDPVASSHEADDLLAKSIEKLGLQLPSRSEAAEILLQHYATGIVSGLYSPAEGLSQMMRDVYWPEDSRQPLDGSHDMRDFIGSYWNYDDLSDAPDSVGYDGVYGEAAFRAFDEDVRRLARDWLTRHPSPPESILTAEYPHPHSRAGGGSVI
ncbi:MAG: hypothetical protein V4662_26475 [Verrucomicrobiota bacterium]